MNESEARLGELLDAVVEGEQSALEQIYKLTGDKLYGVVLRILRKPDLATDALADTYLRVWRDALLYSPALLDAESWLVMHARRAALDLARQRAELGYNDAADSPVQTADADSADEEREMSDELRELLACMATLSPDPRLMLLLAYFDGWNRGELAIEFDAPPGTIRTWMLRGLEQIRECSSS